MRRGPAAGALLPLWLERGLGPRDLCQRCYSRVRSDEKQFRPVCAKRVLDRDGPHLPGLSRHLYRLRCSPSITVSPGSSSFDLLVTLCPACHAVVERTEVLFRDAPETAARNCGRELHPEASEQLPAFLLAYDGHGSWFPSCPLLRRQVSTGCGRWFWRASPSPALEAKTTPHAFDELGKFPGFQRRATLPVEPVSITEASCSSANLSPPTPSTSSSRPSASWSQKPGANEIPLRQNSKRSRGVVRRNLWVSRSTWGVTTPKRQKIVR